MITLRRRLGATLVAAAGLSLVATACSSPAPTAAPQPAASSSAPAADAVLKTGSSSLGTVVTDADGRTVYYFTVDKVGSGASACTGKCLDAWPAVTTTESDPAADGVTGDIGTITLPDGKLQVTVDDRPVYLFAKDTKAGDVLGQGVGRLWYVLSADGTMVTTAPAS